MTTSSHAIMGSSCLLSFSLSFRGNKYSDCLQRISLYTGHCVFVFLFPLFYIKQQGLHFGGSIARPIIMLPYVLLLFFFSKIEMMGLFVLHWDSYTHFCLAILKVE